MTRAPLLVLLALWVTGAAPFGAQARPRPADPLEGVASILEEVERASEIVAAAQKLVRLGSPALEPLFERLVVGDTGGGEAGLARAAVLRAALGQLPRDEVLALLDGVARRSADERRRRAALELVALLGTRRELRLALELGLPGKDDSPTDAALRQALEGALRAVLERDPGAASVLADFHSGLAAPGRSAVVDVLEQCPSPEASALLGGLLGSAGGQDDPSILLALAHRAERFGPSDDLLLLERVRSELGHPDRRIGALACVAVEKLQDHEAVPDLIVLLSDRDANLRTRAHVTLTRLTGLALPLDAGPWIAWLDEELAWWDGRAAECRAALVSGTPTEAAQALREAAERRLFVGEVADVLALALTRSEPDLVEAGFRALGALPEASRRGALRRAAEHSAPALAARARELLVQPASGRQARPARPLPSPVRTQALRGTP